MESIKLMPIRVRVTATLRKALLAGEYKSGDELSLTDISEKLGVSRTPVREAFQTLEAEGLITLRMNRGAIVKPIDEKFILDHYDMRILLEGEAAARAAANGMKTDDLLARLNALAQQSDTMNQQAYTELNRELHMRIWTAADNQKLFGFLSGLWNGPSTGYANSEQDHFRQSTQEHILLLEAIRDGNAESARETMRKHIERSKQNVLKSFQSANRIG